MSREDKNRTTKLMMLKCGSSSGPAFIAENTSPFFVHQGILHELRDLKSGAIKRRLVKENGRYLWKDGGFSFCVYVGSPRYLSKEEAMRLEKSLLEDSTDSDSRAHSN